MVQPELQRMLQLLALGGVSNSTVTVLQSDDAARWQPTVRRTAACKLVLL